MASTTKVEFDVLAHDKASDKLDRIARAFRKVGQEADDVKRADGLNALSVRLKKVSEEFDKEGGKSGKSFGASLKKWVTGEGGGLFKELGKSGGTVFGSGILGALKTPILGPAILAAAAGAVATAAPAAGAIVAGGVVTGFGAGLAGLGIMFAAQSDAVQQKWHDTMSQAGADMRLLSKPFESTLIHISDYFQRTLDKFNPALGKAFSDLSQPVDDFANDAAHSLEGLIPSIQPISNAFDKVLDSVGGALPGAIQDLSTGFTDLANSVAKNPQAMGDTVSMVGMIGKDATDLVTTLNNVNSSFSNMTGGLSLVELALGTLEFPLVALNATFSLLGKSVDLFSALIGRTGKDSDAAGASMSDAANKTVLLAQGLDTATGATKQLTPAQKDQAQATADAAKKANDAKTAFEGYINSLFRLQNLSLGLSGAQIGLQAAIDDASASIKENGRATDINTEKGRNNRTALLNVAKAANDQTEAMQRSGKGNDAAAVAAGKTRASFISLARQMGYTVPQAKAMADSMIAIPNVSRTAKLQADKRDLDTKIAAAKKQLADKSLTATKRAKLQAEIAQLLAAKKRAQDEINALHGKEVQLTITTYKKMIETTIPGGSGVKPLRASGGPVMAGVPYIVGEKRAEVFTPDQNGFISSQVPDPRLMSAASAQPVVVQLVLDGKVVQQSLLKLKRTNGGLALGLD